MSSAQWTVLIKIFQRREHELVCNACLTTLANAQQQRETHAPRLSQQTPCTLHIADCDIASLAACRTHGITPRRLGPPTHLHALHHPNALTRRETPRIQLCQRPWAWFTGQEAVLGSWGTALIDWRLSIGASIGTSNSASIVALLRTPIVDPTTNVACDARIRNRPTADKTKKTNG